MMWRDGTVTAVTTSWAGCTECTVEVSTGESVRSLAYTDMVGQPRAGDRVILAVSALVRGLGTGGYAMIVAIPDRLPEDPEPLPGHIVKARYTPLQYMTLGVDEQESEHHEALRDADSIEGMPVVVADLHSALPAVVAALRARKPNARIAYVMDDGAALPAWFSRAATALTERGDIIGTITTGQAFGGDLEAVTAHTALLAAKHVWHADVAVVAQGPGNLGTGTRWGFSGTRVGDVINAVNALGGRAVGLLRMSSADRRGRHYGLSHHTVTALTRVALSPAYCPVPLLSSSASPLAGGLPAELHARVREQLDELFACERLSRMDIALDGLDACLEASPVPLRTMGRGLHEDPLAFLAAGAAGYAAAELLEARPRARAH